MTKLYLATMTTENYTFQSIGSGPRAAETAVLRGWITHLKQVEERNPGYFDTRPRTVPELKDYYGITVTALGMNDCARDGEALNLSIWG